LCAVPTFGLWTISLTVVGVFVVFVLHFKAGGRDALNCSTGMTDDDRAWAVDFQPGDAPALRRDSLSTIRSDSSPAMRPSVFCSLIAQVRLLNIFLHLQVTAECDALAARLVPC
jgi:hypothetical protein